MPEVHGACKHGGYEQIRLKNLHIMSMLLIWIFESDNPTQMDQKV